MISHPNSQATRSGRVSRGLAIATAMLTALCLTQPASADTNGATPATVTVLSGALSITVPANAGNLGSRANTVGGGTISGPLGEIKVSDARSAGAGASWVASVISTAFTAPGGQSIGAAFVGYTVGPIVQVGTATYTPNDPPNLTGVSPAVTATGITGDNSATWNPTINIAVPGGMAAGVYSGVITHSVV
jgi:hypothetical protein